MGSNDDLGDDRNSIPAAPEEKVDVEALRAELAEAKRIGRWLYDRAPGPRLFLGDVSEWPWLVEPTPSGEAAAHRLAQADGDWTVLRAFAVVQASGDDPYDAEDVSATLGLTVDEFDGSVRRLVHGGLVTGGRLFRHAFVETVTDEGMAAAGMLDADGLPLRVLRTDLASFAGAGAGAGYGTLRIPDGVQLAPGQTIIITGEDADALAADVLIVAGDTARVRVHWNWPPSRT